MVLLMTCDRNASVILYFSWFSCLFFSYEQAFLFIAWHFLSGLVQGRFT